VSNGDAVAAVRAVGVVPVVTLPDAATAEPLCEALLDAGLPIIEVTFRSEAAVEAIGLIASKYPKMCVGAGTVTDPAQVSMARDAGAAFAVAPGLNPSVVAAAHESGLPFWPGVCTPTEVDQALSLGLKVLKFFPAGALGGARTVKAVLGPFLHLGVEVIPTGQVDEDSAVTYWALDGVLAVGGSWIAPAPLVLAGDWREVSRRARAAVVRYHAVHGQMP